MSPDLPTLSPLGAPTPRADCGPPPTPGRPAASAVSAVLSSGNRCGHDPGAPRFHLVALPEGANRARPAPIAQAIGRSPDYYATPREKRWDTLSQGERRRRLERQLRAAGGPDTAPGRALAGRLARWRQQRSERREAVVAALMLLLAYTDIETLTVAVPAGGGWLGLSAPWIAARTGLSPSRAKRALATLSRCGLLATTGRGRRFDARRRRWVGTGWGPVRRFSFHLVRALGLEVSWDAARRKARKRARHGADPAAGDPAPRPPSPALAPDPTLGGVPAAEAREHLGALRRRLSGAAARPPPDPDPDPDPDARRAAVERARQAAALAADGLSPAEVRRRLDAADRPP